MPSPNMRARRRVHAIIGALGGALILGACTQTQPVEVTRFVADRAPQRLGAETVFVAPAPGMEDTLELSPYTNAVARELARLGYREVTRSEARQIAYVGIDRYRIDQAGQRRGPVSVGVGGGTGGLGSGLGLGLGINLGGGAGPRIVTEMAVALRDASTNAPLWEARASRRVKEVEPARNAAVLADAIFRDFPGIDGETYEVKP